VSGKPYEVMLGFPVRLDFRGIAEEDVAVGKTLTFQAVPSKTNANDLRVETYTMGKNVIEAR
jgi:hypothetical protein